MGCGPSAGAQVFNLRCDPFGQSYAETAFSVEVNEDGNYVVAAGAGFDDGQYFYSSIVTSVVVDQNGQVISVDSVWYPQHATYAGWSNSMDKRADGGFVIGGNTFRTKTIGNWISRAALFMIGPNGSVEGLTEIGPKNQSWIGRQAKQTPDGGYVICGETSGVGNALQTFVIKTDAQGNEEWLQTYGGQWNDSCKSIEPRSSGGYFLGGQYRITSSNRQIWLAALELTGAVAWIKTWGGAFEDFSAHAIELADGHILVAGGLGYGNNGPYRCYLAKLDSSDGTFIWQKEYDALLPEGLFHVAQEIEPGGDLIAGGYGLSGSSYYGSLLRTTSTGDSLWMRQYQYHDSLVSNGRGLFRDVVPTPDGGFIAVGTALQAGPYTQDVWVVKVDSMGCLEPGCHLIQGMETQITNLRDALTVAPNPVVQGGSVHVHLELPENFTPQGALRLTLVSSDGRVVHEKVIAVTGHSARSEGVPLSLDRTRMPAGLYHLHVSDDTRWISGAKLVVE